MFTNLELKVTIDGINQSLNTILAKKQLAFLLRNLQLLVRF
jgi:hypothetical protein